MWLCPECNEAIDDTFDVCWNCGTDQAGEKDSEFRHADEHPAIYSESRPKKKQKAQFGLMSLLVSTTCLAIIFSVIAKGGGPLLAGVLLVLGATAVVLLTTLHIYGLIYVVLLTWIRNRHPHEAANHRGQLTETKIRRERNPVQN